MPTDLTAIAAILLVAGITFISRMAGAFLMSRISRSQRLDAFLDALSISVVAALVASIVAKGGLREAGAVGMAALVMLASRSAVWAMVVGMAFGGGWILIYGA